MHTSLLVIEVCTPCWIPLSKTLQQKSKDYFIDSHDLQWQATIPRLNAHVIGLCPPATTWQPFATMPWSQKKDVWVFSLDFTPDFHEFWKAHQRDRVFNIRTDALSARFTGFSICHLMYEDKHVLKVVQHTCNRICLEWQRGNRYLPTAPKLDGK